MANTYADRVKETTTTTGTGTYDLGGAEAGHQTFVAGAGDASTVYYVVEDGTDWEVGTGTVTDAATDTLSRDTIHASSNAGSAVNWGAGTKNVSLTFPERAAVGIHNNVAVVEFQISGATGGSLTGAAWNTYPFNTEVSDPDNIVTLATNQITLEAGDYEIEIFSSHSRTNGIRCRLQNITDTTTTLTGMSGYNSSGSTYASPLLSLKGRFSISAQKTFEYQVFVENGGVANNLGAGVASVTNTFGQATIKKLV